MNCRSSMILFHSQTVFVSQVECLNSIACQLNTLQKMVGHGAPQTEWYALPIKSFVPDNVTAKYHIVYATLDTDCILYLMISSKKIRLHKPSKSAKIFAISSSLISSSSSNGTSHSASPSTSSISHSLLKNSTISFASTLFPISSRGVGGFNQ